jgi:hypothetical protein
VKSIMENLSKVDKYETLQILNKAAARKIEVSIKTENSEKVYNTRLEKNPVRKLFYIDHDNLVFDANLDVTLKLIVDQRLFFLKTTIKKAKDKFYFETLEEMYELVRRKKPRFTLPEKWTQAAHLQGASSPIELKSAAKIIDLSKAGVRVKVEADLPKYEINQVVNFYFRVHRRAEILVKSKVIYLKNNKNGGPTVGLEFSDNSILIANKIQNVCDDLAFFYAHESDLNKYSL